MSAIPPLLGGEQTIGELPEIDAYNPERSWRLRSAVVFDSAKRCFKAGVAVVSRRYPYRAQLANASTTCSGPKILKPGQKQPLDNGKDYRGRNAEHERSIRCL